MSTEEATAGRANRGRDKGHSNAAGDRGGDAREAKEDTRNEEAQRGKTKEGQTKEEASGAAAQGKQHGQSKTKTKIRGSG